MEETACERKPGYVEVHAAARFDTSRERDKTAASNAPAIGSARLPKIFGTHAADSA